ncbi:hypothetical protein IJ00_21680 [Calothrix sp. 336/3]|nr:hypothetical protein IJ00_21680 [Calothrix sp. 336/3]
MFLVSLIHKLPLQIWVGEIISIPQIKSGVNNLKLPKIKCIFAKLFIDFVLFIKVSPYACPWVQVNINLLELLFIEK